MDESRFDRLTRALGAALPRRAALGGLLAGALAPRLGGAAADAKRGKGRGVSAQRRRRRKKKTPGCVPNCDRRVCGADGCGGSCGACQAPTTCDPRGRCVGCEDAQQCASIACRAASCGAGVCRYDLTAEGTGCGAGRVCCGGECADPRTDRDHCGGCGRACGAGEACFNARCFQVCDVCPSGCTFSSVQAAVDAAAPGATVTLCPGTYTGAIAIDKDLNLLGLGDGPAATTLTNPSAILDVASAAAVTVRNLTITGISRGTLSAISNRGTLTLREVHAIDNQRFNSSPIANSGVLTVIDSLMRGNEATIAGGLANESSAATATLIRTRIEGNSSIEAGGIFNAAGATVRLTDGSVVTGNTAIGSDPAGGILNRGTVVIDATSSVTGNTPDDCRDVAGGTGCPAP